MIKKKEEIEKKKEMKISVVVPAEEFSENFKIPKLNSLHTYEHNIAKKQVLSPEEIQERIKFMQIRKEIAKEDNEELQKKRRDWLDKLANHYFNPPIFVNEMYEQKKKILKSDLETYNFFDIHFNTRTMTPGEMQLDIDCADKSLGMTIICQTALKLLKDQKHFAIFYAEGQKAPQIRIYFIQELEREEKLRRRVIRELFWKKYVDEKYWKFVDKTMFNDGKTSQLEFAPHWRYQTIFHLILEYVPAAGATSNKNEIHDRIEKGGVTDETNNS